MNEAAFGFVGDAGGACAPLVPLWHSDLVAPKLLQSRCHIAQRRRPISSSNVKRGMSRYLIENAFADLIPVANLLKRMPPSVVRLYIRIGDTECSDPCGKMLASFHITWRARVSRLTGLR